MYYLVGVSGSRRGGIWDVCSEPLILGRDTECHVCLAEATASRRHFQISQKDGSVQFDDLGSRNLALVNGVPCRSTYLKIGDEIAVGRELFVLAGVAGAGPPALQAKADYSTNDGPIVIPGKPVAEPKTLPRTVQDLAMLHTISQAFGQCEGMAEIVTTTVQQLRDRFAPSDVWIARVHGKEDLSFYPVASDLDPAASAPIEQIQQVLGERRGLLVSIKLRNAKEDVRVFTLVAPVLFHDEIIAVLAVQTQTPDGAYSEFDLQFLALMAGCLAPFIHSIEHIEQLHRDNERLRARVGESLVLVGESRAMGRVRAQIREAAKSSLNVLITGETGTGKELAARLIHAQSSRASGPLVTVNCAAIPRELFEGELFGHEKGAYTGAHEARVGLIACAHGGTLFLDEVGDLSLENQARILRVVEYGVFRPVGASAESRVNIRVVAATNRDIEAAIQNGQFRTDLYHRLNGFEVSIPPLRERVSDIVTLAEHFFAIGKGEAKHALTGFEPEAIEYLRMRQWSGNVRELRNCILRAIAIAKHGTIQLQDVLDHAQRTLPASSQSALSLVEAEKRHIRGMLEKCNGNIREAAKALQVSPSTLYRKMNQYNIK